MAEEKSATAEHLREQASRLTEQTAEQASRITEEMTEQASRFPFFQFFPELNAMWWHGAKQMATWYIDTTERLVRGALDFQGQMTGWAKDTPWAPLLESQHTLAQQWVDGSFNVARRLWQIDGEGEDAKKKTKK